ncbi:alcohol dehydrogenase catalytic domain-containing protein [Nocardia sp. CC227C]|uniref:alcohol dehydrogenase catalytic domain-containing protein n=1 Tax=Nocardia sp. CC227C TaxID=3044562 RepID=UPI00278C10DC|nr:alcohol dehydrogenase catalytic domain-containing protein [Nocardia sp. CC227C]
MKALVCYGYGAPESLQLTEIPRPVPGPGQLLVKVAAVALNPRDILLVTGTTRDFLPVEPPFIPGMEYAGTVVSIGLDVSQCAVGDEILAWTYPVFSGTADYALVDEGPTVAHRHAGLAAEQAAALPVGAMAAATLLVAVESGRGRTLLVDGASGEIGHYLGQLAHRAGHKVFAIACPDDAHLLGDIGTEHPIERRRGAAGVRAFRPAGGGHRHLAGRRRRY